MITSLSAKSLSVPVKTKKKIAPPIKKLKAVASDIPVIKKIGKTPHTKKIVETKESTKTNFIIETVKWKWTDSVKNKNVYRDDEFIRSNSKEDALADINYLLNNPKGLTYTITVLRDGEYFTYYRHSMPCLGGLVKYRDSHGEKYFMNPYFPRDIKVAFPEGEIIFIGIYRADAKKLLDNPYNEFVFSQESPWVKAFGDKKTIIFKDNYFVLTNMDGDPTVFYSLMRLSRMMGGYYGAGGQNKKIHPKVEILLGKNHQADPRRLAGQKPIFTSGGSWSQSFGYTRPFCEYIFQTSLPTKIKDFGALSTTGYPTPPSFTNKYFVDTMKNVFGMDMNQINISNIDDKTQEILIKSWDYFKEKSAELDEYDKTFRD